jgi:DnaA family protein
VAHLVCIDNLYAWAGDVDRERALFTLFEQIKHAGGQLLVTALQRPESCGLLIRDLVSRLSSGLIYAIQELTDEQRVEAIKMRAGHRGLAMADEVIKYLVSRAPRDTAVLFQVLDEIDRLSLVEKRRITIPFLQDLLKNR